MIDTERLTLRMPTQDEATAVAEYFARNRVHHAASSPRRQDAFYEAAHWREELGLALDEARERVSLRLFAFRRSAPSLPVGHLAFTNIIQGAFKACHLGYALDRDAVGSGLMTEAVTAAVAYVFRELKLHRIMANYVPTNDFASRAALLGRVNA